MDIFKIIGENINDLRYNVLEISRAIRDAKNMREKYKRYRDSISDSLYSESFYRKVLYDVIQSTQEGIFQIFEDEFLSAVSETEEFNFPEFQDAFFTAIRNQPNLISFESINNSTVVEIDLNFLGTIEDYAEGVEYARSIFREESSAIEARLTAADEEDTKRTGRRWSKRLPPKRTAARASAYWRNIVYGQKGGPLYTRTVELRLENFRDKAPFWIILDSGTPQHLPSDWTPDRGTAYPISSPTHFVHKAETRIRFLVKEKELEAIEKIRTEIYESLDQYYQAQDEIDEDIALLEKLLEEAINNLDDEEPEDELDEARRYIYSSLDLQLKRGVRIEAVENLLNNLITGAALPPRIYLGYGQAKRTIELQREVNRILGRG